jgi:hypothetical protein
MPKKLETGRFTPVCGSVMDREPHVALPGVFASAIGRKPWFELPAKDVRSACDAVLTNAVKVGLKRPLPVQRPHIPGRGHK